MTAPLEAGFATADITPSRGAADTFEVLDPIYLRALVLNQGPRTVTFLAADLFALDAEFEAGLRARLRDCPGLDPDWVLPGAAHLGTGPTFFSSYVNQPTEALKQFGGQEPYIRRAADCVREAYQRRAAVRAAVGLGAAHGLSYNRRAHDASGALLMVSLTAYPTPPPEFRYDEVNPRVGVLRLETADESRPFALFTFGCHALARWDQRGHISGDWPGEAARLLGQSGIEALFFQGCGNVHPVRRGRHPARRIGHGIAGVVLNVFHSLQPAEDVALRCFEKTVTVPVRGQPPVEVARQVWHDAPARGEGLQRYHYWLAEKYRGATSTSLRLCAMALGDALLLHVPGELFAETAAAIRGPFPGRKILLLCGPTPEIGYVPTAAAHAEGGDEPLFAPLESGAEQVIVAAATELIREAFPSWG